MRENHGMKVAIRHSGVVVSDLNRALEFYRDVLDFKVQVQMDESGPFISQILGFVEARVTTVKMTAPDGGMLELLKFDSPREAGSSDNQLNARGWTHIALTVGDLDGLYEKLGRLGVAFTTKPLVSPNGKAKVTFCRDPEGNFLELVQEL